MRNSKEVREPLNNVKVSTYVGTAPVNAALASAAWSSKSKHVAAFHAGTAVRSVACLALPASAAPTPGLRKGYWCCFCCWCWRGGSQHHSAQGADGGDNRGGCRYLWCGPRTTTPLRPRDGLQKGKDVLKHIHISLMCRVLKI